MLNEKYMSPAEEAELLIFQYYDMFEINLENSIAISEAQACALVAVQRIMKECWDHREIDLGAGYDYWVSVKEEIEKYEGIQ
jgi:hypothetical protein